MIGSLLFAATGAISAGKLPSAPPNCASMRIGTVWYVQGEVYLASHQDTVALKTYGFRKLEFVGRSLGSVKYAAIWPETVPLDKLATIVSGLEYAEREPETPDVVLDANELIEAQRAAEEREAVGVYPPAAYYVPAPEGGTLPDGDISLTTRGLSPRLKFSRLISLEEWMATQPEAFAPMNLGEGAPRYATSVDREESVWAPYTPPSEPPTPAPSPFSIGSNSGPSSLRPYDFGILRTYHTFKTGQTQFPIEPPISEPQRR